MERSLRQKPVESFSKFKHVLIFLFLLLLGGIYLTGLFQYHTEYKLLQQYTTYHTIIEFLGTVICVAIFIIAWYNFQQTGEIHEYILCLGFLISGIFNLAHAMSYPGMPDFFTPNSYKKAFVFWILARLIVSVSIMAALLLYRKKISWSYKLSVVLFFSLSFLSVALVLVTKDSSIGNIFMNRSTDFMILAILAVSLLALFSRRNRYFDEGYLLAGAVMAFMGHIVMVYFSKGADLYDLLGHIYWSGANVCVVRALLVSSAVDLTETNRILREVKGKLAEANDQLVKVNQLKTDFLANTSHELRTPLTAIIAFTELLMDEETGPLNEIQKDYLSEINESGLKLLTELNNLLDLTKIEAGTIRVYKEMTYLPDYIQQVLNQLAPLFKQKEQRISAKIQQDLPHVYVDVEKIKKILLNLLSNAHKFTGAGGEIAIETALSEDGTNMVIKIQDSGQGLTEEQAQHIFDKFYTGENSLTRQQSGTGLGLTLVKYFIELHEGQIWVESEKNRGSIFTVALPVHPLHKEVT